MDEDGFISNLTIGNVISKPKISSIDKKKDKKKKYLERKMIKKQNRKKYEEIIEKKREERKRLNVRNENNENKNNFIKEDHHPISKYNTNKEIKENKIKEDNIQKNKEEIHKIKKENKKTENNIENEEMKIEQEKNDDLNAKKINKDEELKEKEIKGKKENILKDEKNIKIENMDKNENNKNNNDEIIKTEEKKENISKDKKNIKNEVAKNNISVPKKTNSSQTIFSVRTFDDLKINNYLKKALNKNNYNTMTKIQKKAIPILLEHKNVIVKSETGSGKTLAYIIPLYQSLIELNEFEKINRKNGVYSIIFSPTHELCLQIEKTFDKLKSCCINVVYGALMGGQKIETEKKKLRKGLNVIITTPGRLLYHLKNTENINFTTLKIIIMDEADLMLDMGFEKDIRECLKLIVQKSENLNNEEEIILNPDLFKKFKIFLISATIDNRIRKMSNYFMKGFKAIGFEKEDERDKEIQNENKDEEGNNKITEEDNKEKEEKNNSNISSNYYLSSLKQQNITQYYSYINDEYRLIHLIAFLYNNLFQKIIIFVSTCDLCEYLSKIITDIEIDINYKSEIGQNLKESKTKSSKNDSQEKFIHLFNQKTYKLHGKMKHEERKIVFNDFNDDNTGILIATDVAARGLDFKDINWVIHYDINPDIKEYINRIGRTARIDNTGNSILFLMQNERKLLDTCFKPIKNNLNEIKNSDILIIFLKNINKNILKNKINENIKEVKYNTNDDIDTLDENEIYKKKYLYIISPILRCIKGFVFKDKTNLIMARKAFKSEIRAYVTFLKFAKDVFNVKALNLTRMSRSFGLYKESLSMKVGTDQVNVDYQIDKKEKFTQKKFLNKKIQNKLIYSEFE